MNKGVVIAIGVGIAIVAISIGVGASQMQDTITESPIETSEGVEVSESVTVEVTEETTPEGKKIEVQVSDEAGASDTTP